MNPTDLKRYYSERAREYDRIYEKAERQRDLARLKQHLRRRLAGADVLELACGTGYWTAELAGVVRSIVATDVSSEVLAVARGKEYPAGTVRFVEHDAGRSAAALGRFTAVFAAFWWSHVPKDRHAEQLAALRAGLEDGGRIVLVDNLFVEGSSTPLAGRDEQGNTYQERRLENGSTYRVLKNFPALDELRETPGDGAQAIEVADFRYYWCLSWHLPGRSHERS